MMCLLSAVGGTIQGRWPRVKPARALQCSPRAAQHVFFLVRAPYFLEVKREETYQSPEQKEFQRLAEEAGAHYSGVFDRGPASTRPMTNAATQNLERTALLCLRV